jgi:hypothetical protein
MFISKGRIAHTTQTWAWEHWITSTMSALTSEMFMKSKLGS